MVYIAYFGTNLMKKILTLLFVVLVIGGSGAGFLWLKKSSSKGAAELKVNSTPVATVYLDDQSLGKTPYQGQVAAGEYTLKLVPESGNPQFSAWESRIKLQPNLLTFVNRDFSETDLTSGGEVLTLEKSSGKKAELTVLSNPDGATVTVAGTDRGTTPLIIRDLDPGKYDLVLTSAGFRTRSLAIKATGGYKLTANLQLAAMGTVSGTTAATIPSPTPTPTSSPTSKPGPTTTPKPKGTPPPKPYVEVLDTPTGFLNVRQEASTSAEILTKINPGELYSLLDENNGWFKIVYEDSKEGWISGQYAKKYE